MSDSIRRLHDAVRAARAGQVASPRTAKLFARGRAFIAKKVAEEAVEVALDGVIGDTPGTVRESADLLYNLVVLWVELGIEPEDIWTEMRRREQMMGIAGKLPKSGKRDKHAAPAVPLPSQGVLPLPARAPLRNRDSTGLSGYAGPAESAAIRVGDADEDAALDAAPGTAALVAPPLVPNPRRRSG
ncbi:phosphoribosyl-ATP pyrophosphohydrolase [Ancylobacter sp. 3268]|nr:phosphoribosyl-ATP pyrophosphohydrolase [Ancylobacter sp. 3268]